MGSLPENWRYPAESPWPARRPVKQTGRGPASASLVQTDRGALPAGGLETGIRQGGRKSVNPKTQQDSGASCKLRQKAPQSAYLRQTQGLSPLNRDRH